MKNWTATANGIFAALFLVLVGACATSPPSVTDDPRVARLGKQVSALQTEIVDLKNLVAVRDLSISDLNLANAQLKLAADKLGDLQDQVATSQSQLADKTAMIAKLGAGDSKLQAALDANAQLQAKLTDISKQLLAVTLSANELTERNRVAGAKLASMTATSDQSAKRIIALEASYLAKIDALNQAAILSGQKIATLESQVDAMSFLSQAEAKDLEVRVAFLTKIFAKEIAAGDIEVKRFRNVLVIDVKDSVLFAADQAVLLPQSMTLLRTLADAFSQVPDRMVRVEGNTAVAISSPEALRLYPTSWHLGAARAVTVVQFLQEQAGMDPHQLVATSQGEYNPKAENASEAGKAKNRRVEFVIVAKELWQMDQLVNANQ